MKVERRCMAREHTLRGHHGRSMVNHDGGRFASLPPFFARYRLISMHHREGTGSEAAAFAQHAISERHRWTEVVDYLQHKGGWIRKSGSVIPPIENSFIFMNGRWRDGKNKRKVGERRGERRGREKIGEVVTPSRERKINRSKRIGVWWAFRSVFVMKIYDLIKFYFYK